MTETKVECPKCRQALTTPLHSAADVRCPRCQTIVKRGSGAAPSGSSIRAAAPMGTKTKSNTAVSPKPGTNPAPTGSALTRALGVLAFLAVLAGGGGYLAYVCFRKGPDQGVSNPLAIDDGLELLDADTENKKLQPVFKPLIAVSPEDAKEIQELVRKGVDWLKKSQDPDGSWLGKHHDNRDNQYAAFGGLTLLECGVPPDDPAVEKVASRIRAAEVPDKTYGLSLSILFLSRLNHAKDQDLIQHMAMRLVAGQGAHGGWSYENPRLNAVQAKELARFSGDLGRRTAKEYTSAEPVKSKQWSQDVWKMLSLTPDDPRSPWAYRGGDNSNTQFATLALWAARRHKAPVDRALDLLAKRFRNSQNPDGSWYYTGQMNVNASQLPTMTAAGLLGMAVGYGLSDERGSPLKDPMIEKGLAHLGQSVESPSTQQKPPMGDMYFMWSVERVAVLYQLPTIAGKEWYRWGVRMLRGNQLPNGSWTSTKGNSNTPFTDTCFALLFLQRVNLVQDLTDKLNEALAAVAPRLDGNKQ